MRAMSTAASVWPARTSTPPSRATSGKTCPGAVRSLAPIASSIATAMVRARSCAEMPVVTPSRASIETVKAVPWRVPLFATIGDRRSASARATGSARQISPRASRAMKLICSGVANCAGMTRSPSFSRSSASTMTNGRPARASARMSSIGEIMPGTALKRTRAASRSAARSATPSPPGRGGARRRSAAVAAARPRRCRGAHGAPARAARRDRHGAG